jgi:Domain of unknown function (DUF4380)
MARTALLRKTNRRVVGASADGRVALLVSAVWLCYGCGDSHGPGPRPDAAYDDAPVVPESRDGKPIAIDATGPVTDSEQDASGDGTLNVEAGTAVMDAQAEDGADDLPNADGPALEAALGDATDAEAVDAPSPQVIDAGRDRGRAGRLDGSASLDSGKDGGGEAGVSNLVVPTVKGTIYTFTAQDIVFAVDASIGGRVVTYALGGHNILTTPAAGDSSNYGSTFWSSPQSDWSWPPPSQIDPGAYTSALSGGVLTLTSATATSLGLAVTKQFSMDGNTGEVTLRYGMVNQGSKAHAFAPWEITRVAAGGLTFFPMGDGSPAKGSQDLLKLTISDGVAWFDYDAKTISNDQKVYADGAEGWIAHVDGDLLLLKAFGDTTPAEAAPGEAEIELFANAGHTYIEVENQGAYANIAAKSTSQWTVRWFLQKLDPSVSVAVGSADLLAVVRGLVGG